MDNLYKYENVLELSNNFDGWLSPQESKNLYDLVQMSNPQGAFVEIGSWCGKSMSFIASSALNLYPNPKIYSIDPYVTSKNIPNGKYETFVANMKKINLWDKITQIKEKSQEVGKKWEENISFIFIDGFHRYDAVKADFEMFYPHVLQNGYSVFHDVLTWKGPTDLVIELLKSNDTLKFVNHIGNSLTLQKVQNLTDIDKENNLIQAANIEEKAKNKTLKI